MISMIMLQNTLQWIWLLGNLRRNIGNYNFGKGNMARCMDMGFPVVVKLACIIKAVAYVNVHIKRKE